MGCCLSFLSGGKKQTDFDKHFVEGSAIFQVLVYLDVQGLQGIAIVSCAKSDFMRIQKNSVRVLRNSILISTFRYIFKNKAIVNW